MKWILIAGVLVFFLALFNGFIGDDSGYINHPYIQKLQISKLFTGSSSDLGGSSPITGKFYRPLMLVFLSSTYQIFHQQAWGYHFFQVSLFIVNGYLVYFLLRKFFNKKLSTFLAIIFLVHPINSETVLYISNLQDVLMMTFGLLALLVASDGLWVMSLLVLALFAKETGVLFLVVALLLKKISWQKAAIIIAGYLGIRFLVGVGWGGTSHSLIGSLNLGQRLLLIPQVAGYYLKTFFWPDRLAIGQTWLPKVMSYEFLVMGWLIVGFLVYLLMRKRKHWFWMGWVFLGLLPHLQIIPLEMTVADRWFYFAGVGMVGILGVIGKKWKSWMWITVIILLGLRTIIRVQDFRSYERLLVHDSKVTDSYLLEQALGYVQNSIEHTQKSIQLFANPVNTNTLGVLYFRQNNLPEAVQWFSKSISLGDNYQAYNNLTRLLIAQGEYGKAENVAKIGTQKFPQSDSFWFLMSISYYRLNQLPEAKLAIIEALKINKSQQNLYVYNQLAKGLPIDIR